MQTCLTEIPKFFTDEECEMIIDLALEKGMSESPLTQDADKSADEDPWEDKIKAWDRNKDGFIDTTEVSTRENHIGSFLTRTLHNRRIRSTCLHPCCCLISDHVMIHLGGYN